MEEIDKLEHFTISRRRDGSLWELGRGAMGVTYKALDTNLQSEVALKVISAQYLGSEPARQRFLREARAAASLRHPNVTADPKKSTDVEFKHEYGSVVVHSDQPDISVVIDGTSLGKAPLTQWLAPGNHQVAAVASGRAAQTQELNIEAKETRTLHFGLTRAVDTLTAPPSPTPGATSSDGLPALLTAPGLKPGAEGSAPSTSQPGSALSPTVRPPLQPESTTERTGQNRSLPHQSRVLGPYQLRQQARPAQSPIFLTRESYGRAKREAFRQFDAQWSAKRDDLRRQRDWLSYQINHSTGTAQEKLKAQMEQVKGQIDQLDGQRRSARKVLRQSWEGLRTGQ